jgi:uncharacterized protein (TIGR03083 family)
MDDAYVDFLAADGRRMADLAAEFGLNAVAPCPDWTVRELLLHTGSVHRWANNIVTTPVSDWGDIESVEDPAATDDVVGWFVAGHAELVSSLRSAAPDLDCVMFLESPSARLHWRRRQAHETAIHRVDLEEAVGAATKIDAQFADDGIDELLVAFMSRRNRGPRIPTETRLLVEASDTGSAWLAAIGPESASAVRASGDADVRLRGTAANLYTGLWNRQGRTLLTEEGPPELMEHWRNEMRL